MYFGCLSQYFGLGLFYNITKKVFAKNYFLKFTVDQYSLEVNFKAFVFKSKIIIETKTRAIRKKISKENVL